MYRRSPGRVLVTRMLSLGIVFCLLVVVAGCSEQQPAPPPGLDDVQLVGWQAYVDLNCASCHGENREGLRAGPALFKLSEHWSVEDLVSYLEDPDAMVALNPRLAYKAEKYALGMPKVSGKTPGYADKALPEKLEALAGFLLFDPPSLPSD